MNDAIIFMWCWKNVKFLVWFAVISDWITVNDDGANNDDDDDDDNGKGKFQF